MEFEIVGILLRRQMVYYIQNIETYDWEIL